MDLQDLTGLNYLKTDHQTYYHAVIEKLGGLAAIRPYIPFSDETLQKSYAKDKHFNNYLTPLKQWDDATGIFIPAPDFPPRAINTGLFRLLARHGVTCVSLAECVCILKCAARELQNRNLLNNLHKKVAGNSQAVAG